MNKEFIEYSRNNKEHTTGELSLRFLILLLIIPFSGYYINSISVSPVYIITSLGLFFFFAHIISGSAFKIDRLSLWAITLVLYFLLSQALFSTPKLNVLLNVIFSIILFVIAHGLLARVSYYKVILISKCLVYVSLPLLIFESLFRILNPLEEKVRFYTELGNNDIMFYIYKFNSVMYQDSNFVAMFILPLLFFWIYLNSVLKKKGHFVSILLSILIIATISRAAILSMLLFFIFYNFRNLIYRKRKFIFISSLLFIPLIYVYALSLAHIDGSFHSKFLIVSKTIDYLSSTNFINLLFGVGFGNASTVLNMGAHNIFVVNIVEAGLLGLILTIILWYKILLESKYKAGIVMFPYILAGLSFSSLAIPFVYIIFALILDIEKKLYE